MRRWPIRPFLVPGAMVVLGVMVSACGGDQPTPSEAAGAAVIEEPVATEPASPTATPTEEPLPDLVVSSGKVSMQGVNDGCVNEHGPVMTEICVKNQGSGEAGPFVVRAQLYGLGALEWEVRGLAAGEVQCLQDEGNANGRVRVDADGAVMESDEGNNVFLVSVPTPPPICAATPTETVPAPPSATPFPEGSKVTTEVFPVYDCRYLGGTTFEWYKVEVTYVDGVPVSEEILDGPFIDDEWRGGCPPGED